MLLALLYPPVVFLSRLGRKGTIIINIGHNNAPYFYSCSSNKTIIKKIGNLARGYFSSNTASANFSCSTSEEDEKATSNLPEL